jgi:hypothetical protein
VTADTLVSAVGSYSVEHVRLLTRISRRLADARWSDGAGELLCELRAA